MCFYAVVRDSTGSEAERCATARCMFGALAQLRLRGDGDGNQHGGYSLVTNVFWLFWTHGPVGWQGTNKVGWNVNVLSAWKIPGDVAREAGAKFQSHDVWTRHAILLRSARIHLALRPEVLTGPQESQWSQGSGSAPTSTPQAQLVFTPGRAKEKLWCGWAGWGSKTFGFRVRHDIFRRGVFAEKNGGTAPRLPNVSEMRSARGLLEGTQAPF